MSDSGVKLDDAICGERYWGPSLPSFHGMRCTLERGHDRAGEPRCFRKHECMAEGTPLRWFSPEQKAQHDADKRDVEKAFGSGK